MTNVTVIASQNYPDEFRMLVQKQTSNDGGVTWVDSGAPDVLAPGKRTRVSVSLNVERGYVSAEGPINFNGVLQFGGNAGVRFVWEGFNGQEWYDHIVHDNPESPFSFDVTQNTFRMRIEGK